MRLNKGHFTLVIMYYAKDGKRQSRKREERWLQRRVLPYLDTSCTKETKWPCTLDIAGTFQIFNFLLWAKSQAVRIYKFVCVRACVHDMCVSTHTHTYHCMVELFSISQWETTCAHLFVWHLQRDTGDLPRAPVGVVVLTDWANTLRLLYSVQSTVALRSYRLCFIQSASKAITKHTC